VETNGEIEAYYSMLVSLKQKVTQ